MKPLLMAILAACYMATSGVRAEDVKVGFVDRVYKDSEGKEFKYVLFVPHSYKGDKEFPLILFLHGSGAKGEDGKKPSNLALATNIRKNEKEFPFFVVFPQARQTWKAGSDDANRALATLDAVQKDYKIDIKRVSLTGQSMGGYGTWSIAAKHPERWAAIVPICGGGDTASAKVLKDIPCWCFHGDADPTVKVESSRRMIAAIKEAGGTPKYDEYPGVGHNSYDKAYATKELFDWLLLQKRK
ncbi:MAG: hypothetical protein EXS09_22405 [Gemmataceae bacterium]|nr:hypothetical protein [Gemmataceae bacterium]